MYNVYRLLSYSINIIIIKVPTYTIIIIVNNIKLKINIILYVAYRVLNDIGIYLLICSVWVCINNLHL